MNGNKPHICFVALAAWPVLSRDRSIKTVGGAEVQQCILARAFVKRGYRVSMICMDYGQPEGAEIDGVRVLKAHTPHGGLPILRFLYPRFTSIWAAMKRADADIYYQRSGGVQTGYAAAFCRLYGRKFIYAAAQDVDFDPAAPLVQYRRDKTIYSWGLRRSHAIIAQNPAQVEQCRQIYSRQPELVRSCYIPPENFRADPHGYVLWVASLRKRKRPEVFIELARRLPQYRFRMVGGGDTDDYHERMRKLAEDVPNLQFMGFIPHADIEREFDGARLFVNTSELEGFPNTFLQAWSRGIPTVSFIDTGSSANGHPVVNKATTLEEMAGIVQSFMTDDVAWREAGIRCIACYEDQHSLETVTKHYEGIFKRLLA